MIAKKQYKKNEQLCRVTFRIPKKASIGARSIAVVGDFNNWSATDHLMKKLKSGEFTLALDLPANHEYQFRYLINDKIWENDRGADKYIHSEYGNCDNSVVVV